MHQICASFWFLLGLAITCESLMSQDTMHTFFYDYLDSNSNGILDLDDMRALACLNDDRLCGGIYTKLDQQIKYFIHKMDVDMSGTVDFDEFIVKYKRGSIKDPIESGVQQVHLMVTSDPTQMVVMWVTKDNDDTSVQFGTQSGQYTVEINGTSDTYNVGLDGWHGRIHTVTLVDLEPSTKYFYRCGTSDNWSDEYYFTTLPLKYTQGQYVFAVMGDMGTTIPVGWAVTDQMIDDNQIFNFSMIIHDGDIAYAGTGAEWEIEEVWDIWEDQVEDLAAYVPWMFAVGNHEHYYNYTSYRTRFLMPGAHSGGEGNFWWSMDYGNIHFTFMSTEHDYSPSSQQYRWLIKDLSSVDRTKTPWIILNGHRPMYCSDVDEWNSHMPGAPFQQVIEPLMHEYHVDLYLCGHMHMYERVYPVLNGTVFGQGNVYTNPLAPAHVVQGTGGVFTDWTYVDPQPAWSAARNDMWGYGRMTINTTHLHYEFMHMDSGEVVDDFWIVKQ